MKAKKILIIEDDVSLSKTIRNILVTNGYDVEIANSGSKGILKVYDYSPDLILCDINMSPIDGYQVYSILNDSSVTEKTPFIFLTGRSNIKDIRLGMELGADDYIVKPFDNEDLLKSIEVRLKKFETLVDYGKNDFRALVELSPNGIFLFDGETIFEINRAFSHLTGYTIDDFKEKSFEDLIYKKDYKSIQANIARCSSGILKNLEEKVKIICRDGKVCLSTLYVAASHKYKNFSLLMGIIAPDDSDITINQPVYDKLVNILSEEHINISGNLASKLKAEFNNQDNTTVLDNRNNRDNFSKREIEVLKLSCKGLPIKGIADELSISDRTVEKHRARLMEKTRSRNIVELIVYAIKNDIVDL